jgi:hypothetical protein
MARGLRASAPQGDPGQCAEQPDCFPFHIV